METNKNLQNFMMWCNTDLLRWSKWLTAEYVREQIHIKRLDSSNWFGGTTMSQITKKAEDNNLYCFFDADDKGKVFIQIMK